MPAQPGRHRRWSAALVAVALVATACATADDGDSADVAIDDVADGDGAAVPADQLVGPAGGSQAHDNLQPSIALNCIIAVQGFYPPLTSSLRHGLSSSGSSSGSPAVRSVLDPMLGEIAWTAHDFVPINWARCDGQLMAIAQHEALFSLLGTTYGGNGTSTFALPDARGRTIVHEGQGTGLTERALGSSLGHATQVAGSANHTHTVDSTDQPVMSLFSETGHDNMQPSLVLNCIIAVTGDFPVRSLRRQGESPWLGEMKWIAHPHPPWGWEFCDGQIKDVATNDSLFSLLGSRFGGDGTATFALPDARGRAFVHAGPGPGLTPRELGSTLGAETAFLTEEQLPSHAHPVGDGGSLTSPAGGDQPHQNMQPSLVLTCVVSVNGDYPRINLRRGSSSQDVAGAPSALAASVATLGEVVWVPYHFEPRNWKLCDGELLEIRRNTGLFSLLGARFGGDQRVTMGLPDARGRTVVHAGQTPDGTRIPLADTRGSEFVVLRLDQMERHTPR